MKPINSENSSLDPREFCRVLEVPFGPQRIVLKIERGAVSPPINPCKAEVPFEWKTDSGSCAAFEETSANGTGQAAERSRAKRWK